MQPIKLAVIGGSGFDSYAELECVETIHLETPYGPAAPITIGQLAGERLLFMPRHGPEHRVAPHLINYRANIWALHEQGVERTLAINAVGGIRDDMRPGSLVLPNQIVDYTHGREHSYFTGGDAGVMHAEFADPYDEEWRAVLLQVLLQVARANEFAIIGDGVHACTQGPRLETAAEIRRLRNDGCDLVGMTGMPEAVLARELGMRYAALGVVVNWAAGLSSKPITLETVFQQLHVSMQDVKRFIAMLLPTL